MDNKVKQQQGIQLNINFDAVINELSLEIAALRKDKAILTGQVQALAEMLQANKACEDSRKEAK